MNEKNDEKDTGIFIYILILREKKYTRVSHNLMSKNNLNIKNIL